MRNNKNRFGSFTRITAVCTALVMLLALASCNPAASDPGSSPGNTGNGNLTASPSPSPSLLPDGPANVYGNTPGNIVNWGVAALQGNWIFYRSNDGGSLYKIGIDGTGCTKLNNESSYYINVVGDWVYYCDASSRSRSQLYKIRTDGTERTALGDYGGYYINVVDDWIYYTTDNDPASASITYSLGGSDRQLYKMRIDGTERTKLDDGEKHSASYLDINVVDGWVYSARDGIYRALQKIRTDGTDLTRMKEFTGGVSEYINVVDGWIYYATSHEEGRKLHKIRTDGSDLTRLGDDICFCINVAGDWIYYANGSDGWNLYKIRTDGTDRTMLNDDKCDKINVVGDWIYYEIYRNDAYKVYKIRTDGTDCQLVE